MGRRKGLGQRLAALFRIDCLKARKEARASIYQCMVIRNCVQSVEHWTLIGI